MKYPLLEKIAALIAISDDMPRLFDADIKKRQHRYGVRGSVHKSLKSRSNRRKRR